MLVWSMGEDGTIEELCGGSGRCSKAGNAEIISYRFSFYSMLVCILFYYAGYGCMFGVLCISLYIALSITK